MGWTVLYIAFGVVALWLLGEVLLQYKARLRWRLLAFVGFATVVVGVAVLSSIPVIALGAMAFAVGQTFVTLSYRRGFSTGWALGGKPGSSRRRRDGMEPMEPLDADPKLEVSALEAHDPASPAGFPAVGQQGHPPEPDPQADTAMMSPVPPAFPGYPGNDEQHQFAGGSALYQSSAPDPASDAAFETAPFEAYAAPGSDGGQGGGYWEPGPYGPSVYGQGTYGAGANEDPQSEFPAGPPPFAPPPGQSSDGYGTVFAQDGSPGQHPADPSPYPATGDMSGYPESSYTQTPPGGVWVPQQRDTGYAAAAFPPPPVPEGYPGDYGAGYDELVYGPGDPGFGYGADGHTGYDLNGYAGYDPGVYAGYDPAGYAGYQPVAGEYDAAGYPVPTGQGGYEGYGQGLDPGPNGYPYDEQRGW